MTWAAKLVNPYRIDDGKKFRLKDIDPGDTGHLHSKEHAADLLQRGIAEMADQQDKLYAQDRWAVLLIFQAMDAAEKMVPSSMSCPASIPKDARCIPSNRLRRRS